MAVTSHITTAVYYSILQIYRLPLKQYIMVPLYQLPPLPVPHIGTCTLNVSIWIHCFRTGMEIHHVDTVSKLFCCAVSSHETS